MDPRTIGFKISIPVDLHDFVQVLRDAVAGDRLTAAAADMAPALVQYRSLRAMLARYRSLASDATIQPTGEPSFGMRAIVGRAAVTQTPIFVGEMDHVIFRPYWNVPRSILLGELLPKLQRRPDDPAQKDFEIVRGESDNAQPAAATPDNLELLKRGVLRLRQRPGPNNALGLIKFVFPNDGNAYFHGTPAQALFSRFRGSRGAGGVGSGGSTGVDA